MMEAGLVVVGVSGLAKIVWRGAVRKGLGEDAEAACEAGPGRGASVSAAAGGGAVAGMEKASEAPKIFGRGWHVNADTLLFEGVEEPALGCVRCFGGGIFRVWWRGSFLREG